MLEQKYTGYHWFTISNNVDLGYNHEQFKSLNKDVKKKQYLDLLSSIEILYRSDIFIGTITSNVSLFIYMRKFENCMDVDSSDLFIDKRFLVM